jgi:hypothetical protein
LFANQRGGALQVGFQTRLATWPEPQTKTKQRHKHTNIFFKKRANPKTKSPELMTKPGFH